MQMRFEGVPVTGIFRRCGRCGVDKPIETFMWRRIDKGLRDNYCRPCRAAYKQEHYLKNKDRYIANAAARTRIVLEERQRFLVEYFKEHPCVDCGETDPIVLEFDHLGVKRFNVSAGVRNHSWEAVLEEIERCEVVCANCHRRRTATRGAFMRVTLTEERAGEGN